MPDSILAEYGALVSGRGARPAPALELPLLPVVWFDEIEPVVDARDFVRGLLIQKSACVVYGAPGSGKTFWANDLGMHVAAGMPWNGRRVEPGGVVYCALEGSAGFRNRVAAWRDAKNLAGYSLPFLAIMCPLNLRDPEADVGSLIATVQAAAGRMDAPLMLIVIDTLSRAMFGGNENSPDDMGALVACMDRIRAETGAAVLFIHHSGKDQAKGARGHSLLQAAIDTEIEIMVDESGVHRRARVVKQRELPAGDVFPFTLNTVELGVNAHGEIVTTCLVEHASVGKAAAPPPPRLAGHRKQALEVLEIVIARNGRTGDAGVPSGCRSIPEKWWRDRFFDQMPEAHTDTKKHAFARAVKVLVGEGIVGKTVDRVWLVAGDAGRGT